MAHFGEGDSHWEGVLAVVKHGVGFGFGCGGDNDFEDGAGPVGMNGAIFGWRFVCSEGLARWVKRRTAEEEMAAHAAVSVGLGQVGGV